MIEEYIRCNNCMWVGMEEDLKLLSEENEYNPEDKTLYWFKGCPDCMTDSYLMDITKEEYLQEIKENG